MARDKKLDSSLHQDGTLKMKYTKNSLRNRTSQCYSETHKGYPSRFIGETEKALQNVVPKM